MYIFWLGSQWYYPLIKCLLGQQCGNALPIVWLSSGRTHFHQMSLVKYMDLALTNTCLLSVIMLNRKYDLLDIMYKYNSIDYAEFTQATLIYTVQF